MSYLRDSTGTRLYYQQHGRPSPDRPTAVLLASWSLDSTMWERQIHALTAAGVPCVALDRRGHGRSDEPGGAYDLDTLADDVAAVVEHACPGPVVVVGHSMGGCEAVRYVSRHPEHDVAGVVLVSTPSPHLRAAVGRDAFEQAIEDLRADRAAWGAGLLDGFFARPGSGVGAELARDTLATFLRVPIEVLVACQRAGTDTDVSADLGALTVPTLIVHGDRDETAPLELTARPTAALVGHAHLSVYEGAPHGLFVTHADRLSRDLVEFCADPARPPRPRTTREVVDELLTRLAGDDAARTAALFAPEVDWALDWPAGPATEAVPWIRHRGDRDAVEQHFRDLAAGHRPVDEPTTVETVVVSDEDAVVVGTLRNTVAATGQAYEARFALHLTVTDGAITRFHVYEDSLAVALAAGAVTVSPGGAGAAAPTR